MKTIVMLLLALFLCTAPTFSQRGGRESGARPAVHSSGAVRTSGVTRVPHPTYRRSFTPAWRASYLGKGHTFRPSRVIAVGRSYRFFYGGRWFFVGPPWPLWWFPIGWWSQFDFYWIDCPDDGSPCFMYNTLYPGFGFAVRMVW